VNVCLDLELFNDTNLTVMVIEVSVCGNMIK
jgi:hypothetical protein